MSMIDFDSGEAFYLKMRLHGLLVTQLVRPVDCSICVETDSACDTLSSGGKVMSFINRHNVNVNVHFEAVEQANGTVIEVVMPE